MDKYYAIKEYRKHLVCPVDVLGCYNIPDVVQDKRLYVLVSLILSVQTKDESVYQTMLSLCTNLNMKEIVKYKVKYINEYCTDVQDGDMCGSTNKDTNSTIANSISTDKDSINMNNINSTNDKDTTSTSINNINDTVSINSTNDKDTTSTSINSTRNKNILNVIIKKNDETYTLTYKKINGVLECTPHVQVLLHDRLTLENLENETNLVSLIRHTGFHNKKYQVIQNVVSYIRKNGYPQTLSECMSIHGFGRKMSVLYINKFIGHVGVSVDTHVHRICNSIGLVHTKTPIQTSTVLQDMFDMSEWSDINSVLVGYGQLVMKK